MLISTMAARRLRPDGPFHLPPTAHPCGGRVTLRVEDSPAQPIAHLTDTRRQETWQVALRAAGERTWEAEILLPPDVTIVAYYFMIDGEKLEERRQREGENTPIYGEWFSIPFKIAVYDPDQMPAAWTQGMVVYQIFPDRFAKAQSDEEAKSKLRGVYGHKPKFLGWGEVPEAPPLGRDFAGGDLRGVIDKLDYIKRLGVDCIYFNPIFEASSNHRYEAIDYHKIDPLLGTEADFDALIEEAHQRDIKIVLDAVFNHCSSDSVYFDITGKHGNGAAQSQDSPYYRWFDFSEWPAKARGWMGFGFMPEFVECPEVLEFFCGADGVTAHWLKKGIDGWRCDVAYDNSHYFWQQFRQAIDNTKPEAWSISEEWKDSTHYLLGDTFNATMNYRLTWAIRGYLGTNHLTPTELDDRLQVLRRDTPPPALGAQMNPIDSHDTDRALTACGDDLDRYRQMIAFLLAYPGAPTIYYGDETGIPGENAEDGRRCMPWDNLDDDLLAYFRRLMTYRQASDVLRRGAIETVLLDDETRAYGFRRYLDGSSIYALFNGSDEAIKVEVPLLGDASSTWEDATGTHQSITVSGDTSVIELTARGAAWFISP